MPDLLASGIRINYRDAGSGLPMVIAHGLFGTLHDWDGLVDAFQASCRIITYDARGHGRSQAPDSPGAYSLDIVVEDMLGVLDSLGIEQAIIGGHSMGGSTALNFALRHPDRCLALILVGTGAGSSDPPWWRQVMSNLADLAENQGMEAVLEGMKLMPSLAPALSHPGLGERIGRDVLESSPWGTACSIRGPITQRPPIFDLESELAGLRLKTQVVLGELDAPAVAGAQFIALRVPGASLDTVSGVGHYPHMEAPARFLNIVARYLRRVQGA